MPNPLNISNIPAPRVEFIDPRTGLMAREWYRFFFNLFNLAGGGTNDTSLSDLQVGPPPINQLLGELGIVYDQAQLASMMVQYEQSVRNIINEIETAPAMPQLGTMAPLQQDNLPWLTFDNTPENVPPNAGTIYWDDGEGTLDVELKGGNVTCKIGVQEYVRAYNETLLTMTKGQIVYISGAQGNRVAVKLAQADGDANSAHTIGIVAETIVAGGEGFVQVSGPIYKVDTLGTIAGDTVYLSPTIAGDWTTTKPVAPDHLVIIGFIERVHASVGSIFIKIDNGYELDELHNVKITSVQPDDLIQYDSAGPYWKNVAPSSVSVGSATNVTGIVAVANGGTGTSTAFTPGSVVFAGASGVYSQNNANLFWDNTNNRLGIGTTAPAAALDLFTGKLTGSASDLSNRVSLNLGGGGPGGGFAAADFEYPAGGKFRAIEVPVVSVGVNDIFFQAYPPAIDGYGYFETWQGAGTIIGTGNATPIIFRPNRAEVMRLTSAGNLGIGTTNPTQKLDVFGAIAVSGTTVIDATRTLFNVGLGSNMTVSQGAAIRFAHSLQTDVNDGTIGAGSFASGLNIVGVQTSAGTGRQIRFYGSLLGASSIATPLLTNAGTLALTATGANIVTLSTNGAERMRITSSGHVGIGTVPSAWVSSVRAIQLGSGGSVSNWDGSNGSVTLGANLYDSGGAVIRYINSAPAAAFNADAGAFNWNTAPTGVAGNPITFSRLMTLTSTGSLGIGATTNLSTLTVNGSFASKSPSTVNAATYTVAATDGSLRFTTTNCTVTLPAAASFPGRILYLNTITANSVTSAAANVIPLGSNTAGTAILAATAGEFAMIQSDGTNWITMMSN